jgi:hypothetical protein
MKEDAKQIAICALGPLHVSATMVKAELIKGKIVIISSQAGSAEWRTTQNKDKGGDYGHHMSRAACNIAGVLLSEELKSKKIPVVMLHPGFNRTGMTAKYSHIWDKEGAVDASEGAMRYFLCMVYMSMFVRMYVCIYAYAYVCMYLRMYLWTCWHGGLCTGACMLMKRKKLVHTIQCESTHTHAHTRTHTHTHTRTHTHTHVRTHAQPPTHPQTPTRTHKKRLLHDLGKLLKKWNKIEQKKLKKPRTHTHTCEKGAARGGQNFHGVKRQIHQLRGWPLDSVVSAIPEREKEREKER